MIENFFNIRRERGEQMVAAFVIEPIQGKGVNIHAPGYLAEASRICRRRRATSSSPQTISVGVSMGVLGLTLPLFFPGLNKPR